MKALAIIGAILCAWISGVGASSAGDFRHELEHKRADRASLGALFLLVIAILCGIWAYRL